MQTCPPYPNYRAVDLKVYRFKHGLPTRVFLILQEMALYEEASLNNAVVSMITQDRVRPCVSASVYGLPGGDGGHAEQRSGISLLLDTPPTLRRDLPASFYGPP